MDSDKVFDIMKPGRARPSHTSRPVIVGAKNIAKDMSVVSRTEARQNESTARVSGDASSAIAAAAEKAKEKPQAPEATPEATTTQDSDRRGDTAKKLLVAAVSITLITLVVLAVIDAGLLKVPIRLPFDLIKNS